MTVQPTVIGAPFAGSRRAIAERHPVRRVDPPAGAPTRRLAVSGLTHSLARHAGCRCRSV